MGERPKMPVVMAMRMMMPEKIFSISPVSDEYIDKSEKFVKKINKK